MSYNTVNSFEEFSSYMGQFPHHVHCLMIVDQTQYLDTPGLAQKVVDAQDTYQKIRFTMIDQKAYQDDEDAAAMDSNHPSSTHTTSLRFDLYHNKQFLLSVYPLENPQETQNILARLQSTYGQHPFAQPNGYSLSKNDPIQPSPSTPSAQAPAQIGGSLSGANNPWRNAQPRKKPAVPVSPQQKQQPQQQPTPPQKTSSPDKPSVRDITITKGSEPQLPPVAANADPSRITPRQAAAMSRQQNIRQAMAERRDKYWADKTVDDVKSNVTDYLSKAAAARRLDDEKRKKELQKDLADNQMDSKAKADEKAYRFKLAKQLEADKIRRKQEEDARVKQLEMIRQQKIAAQKEEERQRRLKAQQQLHAQQQSMIHSPHRTNHTSDPTTPGFNHANQPF